MTTYKEVFQLAQEKGFRGWRILIANSLSDIPVMGEDEILVELTLIQKWLRDEHRFHIHTCIWGEDGTWHFDVYDFDGGLLTFPEIKHLPSYEEALLQGIHKALKLLP